DAASQRVRGRYLADDEAVVSGRDQRLLEPDLPERAAEPGEPGRALARAVVDLDAVAVVGLGAAELELGVDQVGRLQVRVRSREHVATGQVRDGHPGQVDRDP